MDYLRTCLIVCPLVFLATFIDAVAGGGGLISIPAYLLAGLPTYRALGTNKLVNGIGTGFAAWNYFRGGKIKIKIAAITAAAALAGSGFGTELALHIEENTLKKLLLAVLPVVAVFLFLRKDFGEAPKEKQLSPRKTWLFSLLIGFFIGAYDGLFGPGTGTFMIMAFTGLMGLDLLTASGSAKLGNLASNAASAAVYIANGEIDWLLCIPALCCSLLGAGLGARFAMRGGSKRVRWMIFVVLGILFVKIGYELIRA